MAALKKVSSASVAIKILSLEEAVDIKKLKLWKDNPRRNDSAVPKLARIIKEKGQISPLVAWKKTGVVYKGNTTLKAMLSLGMETARVQWVDFLSEAAAIAYGISDNKSSEWAEWDDGILSKLLSADDTMVSSSMAKEFKDVGLGVTLSADIGGSTIDDLVFIKKVMGTQTLNILNYGYVSKKMICITDLDNTFSMSFDHDGDFMMDINKFDVLRSITASTLAGIPVDDFPSEVKHCSDDKKILPKNTFIGIVSMIPFASSEVSGGVLKNVCFSDYLVYATDGRKGRYKNLDKKLPMNFCLNVKSVRIIDSIIDRIKSINYDDKKIMFHGDGFNFSCNYSTDTQPNIKKALTKNALTKDITFTKISIGDLLAKALLVSSDDGGIDYVIISKSGLYLRSSDILFTRDVAVTINVGYDAQLLNLCYTDEIMQTTAKGITLFNVGNGMVNFIAAVNIKTAPDYTTCNKVDVMIPVKTVEKLSVSFSYDASDVIVCGTVKGNTVESCVAFIKENFKNAKV